MGQGVAADRISMELLGGLGNQLFIYAAGLNVARRLGCRLELDLRNYRFNSQRRFEIGPFIEPDVILNKQDGGRCGRSLGVPQGKDFFGSMLLRANRSFQRAFVEASFRYDPRITQVATGTRLRGYFQSWRYFEDVAPILMSRFNLVLASSSHRSPWQMIPPQPWVAVHVRRGDYRRKHARTTHGLVGIDYYRRALNLVDELKGPLPIVVFSDEPRLVAEEFESLDRSVIYFDANNVLSTTETLVAMAQASAVITANSSFSWWAAWYGSSRNRPVITPRPWFVDASLDTRDLLPDCWLSLG